MPAEIVFGFAGGSSHIEVDPDCQGPSRQSSDLDSDDSNVFTNQTEITKAVESYMAARKAKDATTKSDQPRASHPIRMRRPGTTATAQRVERQPEHDDNAWESLLFSGESTRAAQQQQQRQRQ